MTKLYAFFMDFGGLLWLMRLTTQRKMHNVSSCNLMGQPLKAFIGPKTDDKGYVPSNKFIITVETPSCSSSGRQYKIKEQDFKHVNYAHKKLQ